MASFFRRLAEALSPSPVDDATSPPVPDNKEVDLSKGDQSPTTESTSPKSSEFTSSSEGLKSAVDRISLDSQRADSSAPTGEGETSAAGDSSSAEDVQKEVSAIADESSMRDAVTDAPDFSTVVESKAEEVSDPILRAKNETKADAACAMMVEIVDDQTGWDVWENKNGIKIEKKNGPDGGVTGRSSYSWIPNLAEVKPYDISFVEECLWELNAKKEYDDQAIEMLLMKEYENDYHVVYQAFKGRFGVPGRDFIVTLHKQMVETEEGMRMVIGAQSTEEEDENVIESEIVSEETKPKYEELKKILVRGHARVAGFLVDWNRQKNEFTLHYVNDADLKTKGIPAWLVTRAKLDQLRVLDKIKVMIEKKRKEKEE